MATMEQQTQQEPTHSASPSFPADKSFREGDCIITEDPWVYAVDEKKRDTHCGRCLRRLKRKPDEDRSTWAPSRCSSCRFVHYCSQDCQRNDWKPSDDGSPGHKYECPIWANLPPNTRPPNHFLLALRILLKLHNPSIPSPTISHTRTYQDLKSHSTQLKQNPSTMEYAIQLRCMLLRYLSFTNLRPNDYWEGAVTLQDVVDVLGRVRCNSYSILDQEMVTIGVGLYLESSRFDHSCQPNACQIFQGKRLVVRANRDIGGIGDVRVSYVNRMLPAKFRKETLRETYFFTCKCPRCVSATKDAEEFALVCINPACSQPIPNDERAELPCSACGTASHPSTSRHLQYDRLVGKVVARLNTFDPQTEEDDWGVFQQCQALLHRHNPLLTVVAVFVAGRWVGNAEWDRRSGELFVKAASFARANLPVVDPLRAYILSNAVLYSVGGTGDSEDNSNAAWAARKGLLEEAQETLARTVGTNNARYRDVETALKCTASFISNGYKL